MSDIQLLTQYIIASVYILCFIGGFIAGLQR